MAKKDSQAVAELLPLRKSQSELPLPESDELLVLSLRARHPDACVAYSPALRRRRIGMGAARRSTSSDNHIAERRPRSATIGSGICW